ncbi:MAG: type II toxin-antitoxin system VapC family toxin [Chloroflexi bacterium]|nr:type II toxin-antitoxin system VapC family toxin [Chloroflexota bacterium]
MYLLDTNVISEFRRARPHPAVMEWMRRVPSQQLHLSAVTIGEIQAGIEITREQDPVRADEIEGWLGRVLLAFDVIPVDEAAFREWARLRHRQSEDLTYDAMIAAVAVVNRLTVVTRNVRDFEQLGVPVINPFEP